MCLSIYNGSFVLNGDIVGGVPGSVFDVEYVRPLLEDGIPYLGFERTQEDQVHFEEFDKAYSACVTEKPGYELQVRDSLSKILLHVIENNLQIMGDIDGKR